MANAWDKLAKRAGKKFEAAKKIASEGGSMNPNVEDGRYIGRLLGLELGQSAAGRDQIKRTFKVTEGESKGEKLVDFQGLDTDKGISFFMRDLKRLGYEEPDGLEECGPIVDEINEEKPAIRFTVKNNGDFQNVYIDKALSADEVEDGNEEGAERAGDDDDDDGKKGKGKEKEDEAVEIEVGMEVVADVDGEKVKGKVVKILEDAGKVKIEDEDGETHKVAIEDVSLPEEDADEDDKKGKAGKKGETDLEDMDRDDLEDLIDKADLDVNPKKFKDDDDLREAVEKALKEKDEDGEDDPDEKKSGKVTRKTGKKK